MTARASRTLRRAQRWGVEPIQSEHIERTEQDEARRATREWLRDRDDENAIDFEDMPEFGY